MTKKRFVTTLILTCCTFTCALSACSSSCSTNGPHVHTFGEWVYVTAPTCTEGGTEERTCGCGEKETRPVNALGHEYGEYVKTEEEHYKKCTRCGEETAKEAHSYNAENSCVTCGYKITYTDTLAYSEIKDGEEVVAYSVAGFAEGATATEEIIVPAYHNGKPVTEIGYAAFYADADNPDTAIKKVTLPSTVTELGEYAFNHCTALEEINLQNVTVYGSCAFWDTALKSVEIGKNVESIGEYLFYECSALESIETYSALPGGYTVYGCSSLKTVIINENIALGTDFFKYADDVSVDVIFGDNVTEIPTNALGYNSGFLGGPIGAVKTVTIGKNVKKINEYALQGCENVEKLSLPEGLAEVGAGAFYNFKALKEIDFPVSLKTVDAGAFYGCTSIEKVNFSGTVAEWTQIDFGNNFANPLSGGSANNNENTKLYADGKIVSGEVTIDGVEEIKAYVFYGYSGFTRIILGESVKKIGQESFAFASSTPNTTLEELVIMGKVLQIPAGSGMAFNYNVNFKKVYYNGTLEEMIENVTAGGKLVGQKYDRVWWFGNKTHYFASTDGTEAEPESDGYNWTYGGLWYVDDGKIKIW